MGHFTALVAGIFLILCTLPGTVELLLLTLGALLSKPAPKAPAKPLKTAVVVPAHNEEISLLKTLESLKACEGVFEIIVVADNCTDQTAAIAKKAVARVLIRNDPTRLGKHHALEFAFDILLKEGFQRFIIVDADTLVHPDLIQGTSEADCVQAAYLLQIENPTLSNRLMAIAFTAFNKLRPLGRQYWGFSSGIFGNGFSLTADTLKTVPFSVDSIVEDAAYHLKLVEDNKKVLFNPDTWVQAPPPHNKKGLTIQRARWEGGRLRLLFKEGPTLIKKLLQGQGRFLEPLLDLSTLPLGYHALLLLLLLFLPISWIQIYAAFGLGILLFHTLTAIHLRGQGWKDYAALLSAPGYLIWKLLSLPKIWRGAQKDQQWIRTQRKGNDDLP